MVYDLIGCINPCKQGLCPSEMGEQEWKVGGRRDRVTHGQCSSGRVLCDNSASDPPVRYILILKVRLPGILETLSSRKAGTIYLTCSQGLMHCRHLMNVCGMNSLALLTFKSFTYACKYRSYVCMNSLCLFILYF